MGKSVPADGKEAREKWKTCLTFGSRNMMELKQATAQLDLNSDQLQQVKAAETRLHISSGTDLA